MEFHKYPSVESFAHFIKNVRRYNHTDQHFIAKIKLHGTNGAIVRKGDNLYAQSRSRVIEVGNDNFALAQFVASLDVNDFPDNCAIYGEWAGPGVQKSDAVSKIDKKTFFAFALHSLESDMVYSHPRDIMDAIGDHNEIKVLPVMQEFYLNLFDDGGLQKMADDLSKIAESIGNEDPYIKAEYGISGPGEGFVLSPVSVSREMYSNAICKVKCEAHRVKKTKAAATSRVEVPSDVVDFCSAFITDARIEQAVNEACEGEYSFRRIADFAKWFGNDVKKESVEELASMGLEWKDVSKHLNAKSILAFKSKCI